MNLYRIINDIKSTCMSHRDVQDFHYGDIYDYENTKSLKYINTNFTLQNITSGLESDTKTINGVLFCVDRLTDNGDNKLIAQSRCTDILESIINRLTENYSGWSLENTVYEVFSTKFADLCAGCFCTFSLSVDEDSVCSDDDFIVKSKEIKGNGIYDVIGYDRIIVDVQPKLKEIEIVKNGVYLPEKDSDGYNKITVDVPPTPTQEKSVNITENGVKRIVPDAGYNLSGVDVNVNVPPIPTQEKSVNITENGTTSIVPDEGYSLSKVDVNVNVNVAPKKSVINVEQVKFTNASVIDDNIVIVGLKNCRQMFLNCSSLTSIPKMDTSNVTTMYQMFEECSGLTSVPQLNTSNVKNMYQMFEGCSGLTSVPQLNTSNVTNMYEMFYGCLSLTSIPEMDTSNVTTMYQMFYGCSRLTSVPQLNMSNVKNIVSMFNYCNDLSNLGGFVNLGKAFTSSITLVLTSLLNLTNQSVQNLIDTVFDMNQNTQGGSATLRLNQTVIDAMTDTQKSQLAAKGWTLTN